MERVTAPPPADILNRGFGTSTSLTKQSILDGMITINTGRKGMSTKLLKL